MAKRKQAKTGYERLVTQKEDGYAYWSTTVWQFRFMALPGINTEVMIDGQYRPVVYSRNIAEAGFWAEGFEAGEQVAKSLAARAAAASKPDDKPA